jgi:SAM-dependent methyltransferase
MSTGRSNPRLAAHLGHFEALYEASSDPWQVIRKTEEQHKRDVIKTALGARRYGRGLELGCGNGTMSRDLARVVGHLLAVDGSKRSIEIARDNLADLKNVRVSHLVLPSHLPNGAFDAIVASEILYYLPRHLLSVELHNLRLALRPGGRLVTVNHVQKFSDGEVTYQDLSAMLRRVFGCPIRHIATRSWRCDVFGQSDGTRSHSKRCALPSTSRTYRKTLGQY